MLVTPLRFAAVLVTVAATGTLMAGVASADHTDYAGDSDATCLWVGGREKVKVTVSGRAGGYYLQGTDAAGNHFHLGDLTVGPDGTGTARFAVTPAGTYGVEAFENFLGSGGRAPGCATSVAVSPANPALDALDGALAGAGSSALVTDPAAR